MKTSGAAQPTHVPAKGANVKWSLPKTMPAPPSIPPGKWRGYREYIGPHGEWILYQPSLKDLLKESAPPPVVPLPAADEPAEQPPQQVQAPVRQLARDDHPHTVEKPGTGDPNAKPGEAGTASGPFATDGVDEELLRHREWLRHRFDPKKLPPQPSPAPSKPDPTKPGTYKRLWDEAEETRRRIAQLERERWDSYLPDWLWDQLFGQELRLLLVHLRAMRWQIEEFEKAWANGDDPVAAVNRYNRRQWQIFLQALQEHLQLLGLALTGIEVMKGFQKALEEALQAANAARRRAAKEWLRMREKARADARKNGKSAPDQPPPKSASGQPGAKKTGGLTEQEWRRIKARKEVDELPQGSKEWKEANKKYKQDFPSTEADEARFGQTFGTITRSADGKTVTITTCKMSPDGTVTTQSVQTIPTSQAPVDLGLQPGQTAPFAITNTGG